MKIRLEFQHFHGCSNGPIFMKIVQEALQATEVEVEFIETIVGDEETAQRINFLGSPTLLVNGKDLLDIPLPAKAHLACRFYPDGLPSKSFIIQRIMAATFLNDG